MTPNADYVSEIAARKSQGIDCTEDESAIIKRHFDQYESEQDAENDELAGLFPLEFAEWCEARVHSIRGVPTSMSTEEYERAMRAAGAIARFQITFDPDAFDYYYAFLQTLVERQLAVELNGEPLKLVSVDCDSNEGVLDPGSILQVRDINELTPPRPYPLYDHNGEPTVTSIHLL